MAEDFFGLLLLLLPPRSWSWMKLNMRGGGEREVIQEESSSLLLLLLLLVVVEGGLGMDKETPKFTPSRP
jgi:hypothetical protein